MSKLKLQATDGNGGTVSLKGPASTTGNAEFELTLPGDAGSNGQVLSTNGSGVLTWSNDANVGGATGVDFNDSVKAKFGTGSDLQIYHDGHSRVKTSSSAAGNLVIDSNNDINLRVNDSEMAVHCKENTSVELYYDNSKKLETTSTGAKVTGKLEVTGAIGMAATKYMYGSSGLDFYGDSGDAASKLVQLVDGGFKIKDSNKIQFGDSQDLEIFHDGTDSWVKNVTGKLRLCNTNGNGNEVKIGAREDQDGIIVKPLGATEIYHNGAKKFETLSDGIRATHIHTSSAGSYGWLKDDSSYGMIIEQTASKDITIRTDGSEVAIREKTTGYGMLKCFKDGAVELFYDGGASNSGKKLETTATGIDISGTILNMNSGTSLATFVGDSNRSGANQTLLKLAGKWNGTEVSRILLTAGSDTTNKDDGEIRFNTTTSGSSIAERLRVTHNGNIWINQTTDGGWNTTSAGVVHIRGNDTGNGLLRINDTGGASNQAFIRFQYDDHSTNCGGIRRDGTSTDPEFFTGSDRRIKTNVTDMPNVLDKVNQIKIKTWELKSDSNSKGVSPIAQELYDIFPNKVTKTDDGTGDVLPDGVEPWSIGLNYTWELVKSIQELSAEVETLKTRIAALGG